MICELTVTGKEDDETATGEATCGEREAQTDGVETEGGNGECRWRVKKEGADGGCRRRVQTTIQEQSWETRQGKQFEAQFRG